MNSFEPIEPAGLSAKKRWMMSKDESPELGQSVEVYRRIGVRLMGPGRGGKRDRSAVSKDSGRR